MLIGDASREALSFELGVNKAPLDRKMPNKSAAHWERDLARRFDASLVKALGLPERAWYDSLTPEGLLELKVGYARINELITLKLTQRLLHWLTLRLAFSPLHHEAVHARMMAASACEGGFDLD
ncbi:MAG: hypothetical protein ACYC67_17630 [Prosthecobacter sp.]